VPLQHTATDCGAMNMKMTAGKIGTKNLEEQPMHNQQQYQGYTHACEDYNNNRKHKQ